MGTKRLLPVSSLGRDWVELVVPININLRGKVSESLR